MVESQPCGQHVRKQRCLMKDFFAAPPLIPFLRVTDPPHPPKVGVVGIATQPIAGKDCLRPLKKSVVIPGRSRQVTLDPRSAGDCPQVEEAERKRCNYKTEKYEPEPLGTILTHVHQIPKVIMRDTSLS